jgi:hypothetical protein
VFGSDHLDVARSLGNIGNVLGDMGKPEESLVHMQKGLEIQLKLLGSDHPDVAGSKENIGLAFKKMTKSE